MSSSAGGHVGTPAAEANWEHTMRGKLFYSEQGRVVPGVFEPLTVHRRARKTLVLPREAAAPAPGIAATLWVLVRRGKDCTIPLRGAVNGQAFEVRPDKIQTHFTWAKVPLGPGALRPGENHIDLWCDALAQDAWDLALEGGYARPDSAVSFDGGRSWHRERMGVHHNQRAEYVVRLRVHSAALPPDPPPAMTWEDPQHVRVAELRELLPREVVAIEDRWERARALASWVSCAWPYANADDGAWVYTPWDPWTLLARANKDELPGALPSGLPRRKHIQMCVHYAAFFTSACLAAGVPARSVVTTQYMDSLFGHFVAEVWHDRFEQWCLVDPNADMVFLENGRPLSMAEASRRGEGLRPLAQVGPGGEFHHQRLSQFVEELALTGRTYRRWSVWRRNDYLSRPDVTPPSHGEEAYGETDIVWRDTGDDELEMFPYLADEAWFETPPPAAWLREVAVGARA